MEIYNYNGDAPAISQKVAVDNAGDVFVAGFATWCDVEDNGTLYNYAHRTVIMYDAFGNPVWTNAPDGGERFGTIKGLIPDNHGNVYVTENDDYYYATAQLTSSGQQAWFFVYGPPGVAAMALDANTNVYLTGGVESGFAYGTFKLDSTGNELWQARYSGTSSNYTFNEANGIALDSIGSVYVNGVSTNSGAGTDFATIKYDSNGNQLWVTRHNGLGNGNDGGNAIAVAPDGSVYVRGTPPIRTAARTSQPSNTRPHRF
jgi:hypothetical protein